MKTETHHWQLIHISIRTLELLGSRFRLVIAFATIQVHGFVLQDQCHSIGGSYVAYT